MPKVKRPGSFFSCFLLLIALVFIWWLVSFSEYYTYASNAIENTASQSVPSKEKLRAAPAAPAKTYDTEIKYRKFFITVSGAKQVELAADFNRWGKDPIVLKGYRKGYFETSVALPAGEYQYVFLVDGKEVLDPNNKDRRTVQGREVCIKTVR